MDKVSDSTTIKRLFLFLAISCVAFVLFYNYNFHDLGKKYLKVKFDSTQDAAGHKPQTRTESISESNKSYTVVQGKSESPTLIKEKTVKDIKIDLTMEENISPYLKSLEAVQDKEWREKRIAQKLKEKGLSSVKDHSFKSIYVREPVIYDSELTPKAPGNRTKKLISCFNCPSWFLSPGTPSYHRDFKVCPYSECSFDGSGKQSDKANVVMFFPTPKVMPPRPLGQIWAHLSWEPPWYYEFAPGRNYQRWKGVFNWTFGFEQGHDFFHPNNLLGWRSNEAMLSDEEYMSFAVRKTKTAAWWVSNCGAKSKRDDYVKEMKKYIDIDIFGRCGPHECRDASCSKMLNDTYKFYLAFENTFCKDYVTPKYFRNFYDRTLILPVVRGGFEYDKYFPPNIHIDANHFKSPKQLALFLKDLAADLPRYAHLLKMKDRVVALNYKYDWCDFCEMLHTNVLRQTIPDVRKLTHLHGICWSINDL